MTILYFTSTGNCLMVAKKIRGEKILSIPNALNTNKLKFTDDAIGLVFPVYGLSVPPIVIEFLEKAELHTDYLYAILTYGTYDAGAVQQLEQIAERTKHHFSYINCLHMQENYLPGFDMKRQKQPSNQQEKLNMLIDDIRERKQFIKNNSWFDRFMTKTHQSNYHYKRGASITSEVHINDLCIGCGACAKLCPTKNITIENGKPVFGPDCLSCLACVQNCPNCAIHLDREKSGERYRNPEITLQELTQGNSEDNIVKTADDLQ